MNRKLPKRFRDPTPEPLPSLPPAPEGSLDSPSRTFPPINYLSEDTSTNSFSSRLRRTFQSHRNIFGLFRRYQSESLPSHDPEEYLNLRDLSDITDCPPNPPQDGHPNFYPYPNESSFRLGEWFWNHGIQKSRESFNKLLDIVGSQQFRPEDVRNTKWGKIDVQLAGNAFDSNEEDGGWIDEDPGWHRTPISISVPFHKRNKNPGPKTHIFGHLYHRTLVSVIREKLGNKHDDPHFHYEPFELFWKPTDSSDDIRVHGELYTSPAFLDAHREVQELSGEPGCNLPRVVIAMMFSSDVTHLTSFGTAKLWPCYLYFGNESKYRRCKPTCHLCNHVAYFETVRSYLLPFLRV